MADRLESGRPYENRERLEQTRELSLGRTVVAANGYDPDSQPILVSHSFIIPPEVGVLPDPVGDSYLNQLGVPASHVGENVLSLPLPKGLQEFYREMGIVDDTTQIYEVNPILSESLGYPNTDPISVAAQMGLSFQENSYAVATFPTSEFRQQAADMGLTPVQNSDPSLTSNKAYFRERAQEHGYNVLPGATMQNEEDLANVAQEFGNSQQGVWVKLSNGSGGDVVIHVPHVTEQSLMDARNRLYGSSVNAFRQLGSESASIHSYWPREYFAPQNAHIVVESDARNHGEILLNGSNVIITNINGGYSVEQYFRQITGESGDFIGSEIHRLPADQRAMLDEQMARIANHTHQDLGLFGVVGVDFMLVKTPQGEIRPYMIELNGRPPISSTAEMIGRKLKAPHWINVNAWAPYEMNDFTDFRNIIGERYAVNNVRARRHSDGLVVPQAFRARWTNFGNRKELLQSSNAVKILITGEDHDHCARIMEDLQERGIRFSDNN